VRVEAEEGDVVITRGAPPQAGPETAGEAGSRIEPALEAAPATEGEPAPTAEVVAQPTPSTVSEPSRPRGRRTSSSRAAPAPRGTATPAQEAIFRQEALRRCRSNLDGQPPTRFVMRIDSPRMIVEPEDTPVRVAFARCLRLNAREQDVPEATYVFTAP
jgi:hypothetical protein